MPSLFASTAKILVKRKIAAQPEDEGMEHGLKTARLLGQGGFASVYQVSRGGTNEALKVIRLRKYIDQAGLQPTEVIERLDRLCTLLREEPHPNVIRYLGWSAPRDELFIRLELCSTRDLFARVTGSRDSHLDEDDAWEVARSLCSAVAFLHAHGWVHRDIKPENILFPREDSPYSDLLLADLGCALDKIEPDDWFQGSAGSPGYCSPEMAKGEPWSMITDEFSIGVTLYECLVGRSPMVSDDPKIAFARPCPFPARYWHDISLDARDFVRRLLNYEPLQRMSVDEGLAHSWMDGNDRRPSVQSTNSGSSNMSWTSNSGQVTRPVMRQERLSQYFSRVSQRVKTIEDLDKLKLTGSLSSDWGTSASGET